MNFKRLFSAMFAIAWATACTTTCPPPPPPPPQGAPERGFFNDLLGKLHLSDLDAGDLLLLFLLFYLSKQKADEELLIAIGLLLIL